MITADILRALGARGALDLWAVAINTACARHEINTLRREAAFLATIMHETAGLSCTIESLNYTPEALVAQWPLHFGAENAERLGRTAGHPADQHMIAELAYGGRLGNGKAGCGDGFTYRGRGLIQLTGRDNYQAFSNITGIPLSDLPALLQLPSGAAESAATYWQARGCNDAADRGDIGLVRRLVNGGKIGLQDVQKRYQAALDVLAAAPVPAPVAPAPAPAKPSWLAVLLSLFRRK